MKDENFGQKRIFLKENGDLKPWVVLGIYFFIFAMSVWLAIEITVCR